MAIVTYPLNGVLYNAEDVEAYCSTRGSGVFAANDNFDLSLYGSNVVIGPGLAWVKNAPLSGKSICVREDYAVSMPTASPILPRIDRLVLRFDARQNQSFFTVISGAEASDPQPPAISRSELAYDLCLYEFYRPAGSTEISWGDVTDTRLDEELCGLLRDGVTGIPTEALERQYLARLEDLAAQLEAIKSMSDVMLRSVYDSGGADQVAYESNTVPKTRKVNGKALSEDITLSASDVGARPSNWTPTASQVGAATSADILAAKKALMPVGYIYQWAPVAGGPDLSTAAKLKSYLGFGTWEAVAAGRVLQGADADHAAGTTDEAGLPNIAGTLNMSIATDTNNYENLPVTNASGPFATSNYGTRGYFRKTGTSTYQFSYGANFDASRSSAIYGASETVQPPALRVYYYQRVA